MVAPDRDTPGISAKHCTMPMTRPSFSRDVALVALLGRRPLGEDHDRRPDDQAARDHPQAAQRPLDDVLERPDPTTAIGIEPTTTAVDSRQSAAVSRLPR